MTFDVAIVGAGIVGAACAAALSGDGLSVVLIDQHGPATGTTAAGMGHIVVMDDSEAQFALTSYSQGLWAELAKVMPAECEYESCGTIWVAADEEEMAEVRRKHDFYGSRGIATEILDEHSLRAAEPNLSPHLVGGLLVRSDSVIYQLAATQFLIARARSRGTVIRLGTGVEAIDDTGVKLADGTRISSTRVINAAGASAGDLSPCLEINKRRGHLIITERYPGFVSHQIVELGYLKSAHGSGSESVAFNVQPRRTGQILLGSSRQLGVETGEVDPQILRKMTDRAFQYMPGMRGLAVTRVWTGFRPTTPNNLPYIGKIPGFNNVYAAAGHEGLGITTALGTAELLTAEILGREPAIPLEAFRPDRAFSNGIGHA